MGGEAGGGQLGEAQIGELWGQVWELGKLRKLQLGGGGWGAGERACSLLQAGEGLLPCLLSLSQQVCHLAGEHACSAGDASRYGLALAVLVLTEVWVSAEAHS